MLTLDCLFISNFSNQYAFLLFNYHQAVSDRKGGLFIEGKTDQKYYYFWSVDKSRKKSDFSRSLVIFPK